jgi:hypothetical protein
MSLEEGKYPITMGADKAAEFLWRSGLLYQINRDVLWPQGYALGVLGYPSDVEGEFDRFEFAGLCEVGALKEPHIAPDGEAKLQRFLESRKGGGESSPSEPEEN